MPGPVKIVSPIPLPVVGTVTVVPPAGPTVATRTSVLRSAADGLYLAANAARRGAGFANDSAGTLQLGLGTAAVSPTSFTVSIPPGGYYELPSPGPNQVYSGEVRGRFTTAGAGACRITELT